MANIPKKEYFRPDYIRFGRDERTIFEILDRRQKNQNFEDSKKQKQDETVKEELRQSTFVDKSAQLSASLTSLALINMVKFKSRIDTLDNFIDRKVEEKSGVLNPFSVSRKDNGD
jgi:hypothetical protein